MQSHPLYWIRFGQYQALSASLVPRLSPRSDTHTHTHTKKKKKNEVFLFFVMARGEPGNEVTPALLTSCAGVTGRWGRYLMHTF